MHHLELGSPVEGQLSITTHNAAKVELLLRSLSQISSRIASYLLFVVGAAGRCKQMSNIHCALNSALMVHTSLSEYLKQPPRQGGRKRASTAG